MTWTPERLTDTLKQLRQRQGDTTTIEVKKAQGGMPTRLGETLCAFANMPSGGTIILGVDEKAGFTVTGVPQVAQLEAAIAAHNRNNVTPAPYLEFTSLSPEESEPATVLIVEVQGLPITDKPATYKGISYLRQSDGDYAMNPVELRMIEIAKLHTSEHIRYDAQPAPNSTRADLNPQLVKNYLEHTRASSRRMRQLEDEDILRATGVLDPQGTPTVAGLYGLGFYPQGPEPALGVTAAVLTTRNGTSRSRNLEHFDGAVPDLLADLTNWVEANLPTYQVYNGSGDLYDQTVLPMTAVREVIANALVHRDLSPLTLSTGKSVQVRITERCLIVESPGGLRGLSTHQLLSEEHAQAAVNQRFYHLMKNSETSDGARVIEGEGGGIREVQQALEAVGAPTPIFTDTGVKFRVVLWFAEHPLPARQEQPAPPVPTHRPSVHPQSPTPVLPQGAGKNAPLIAQSLASGRVLTRAQLADQTGLSPAQVRYAVEQLLEAGLVTMVGERGRKGTGYRWVG